MVNMAVQWRGPNSSLATLAKELNARFGNPSRFYEYVTGYKSASNVTSHNADNNGIGHAMDIFVGAGHNISVEQGIDLAERLRLEGKKGSIPRHPDRLAYIIHRGRIAGDHTNWEWVAYNGIADHYDHIHISSVFDYFWGDVVAGNPADYNSTAAWNLWSTPLQVQVGDITIIKEEGFLLSLSDEDQIEVRDNLRKVVGWLNEVKNNVAPINTSSGPVSLRQFVANGTRAAQIAAAQTADINTAQGAKSLRQFIADVTRASQRMEPLVVDIAEAVSAPDVDGESK